MLRQRSSYTCPRRYPVCHRNPPGYRWRHATASRLAASATRKVLWTVARAKCQPPVLWRPRARHRRRRCSWSGAGLARFLTSTVRLVEYAMGVILAVDVVVVFGSVVFRYFLRSPINWAEEVASALMGMLVFLGAGNSAGPRPNIPAWSSVRQLFPQRWHAAMIQVCHWIIAAVAGGLVFASVQLALISVGEITPLGLPQWIFIYPPIGGSCFLLVVALARAFGGPATMAWWTFAALIGLAVAIGAWNAYVPDYEVGPAMLIGLGAILPLAIGVPIAFALAFSALVYFSTNPSLDISIYSSSLSRAAVICPSRHSFFHPGRSGHGKPMECRSGLSSFCCA